MATSASELNAGSGDEGSYGDGSQGPEIVSEYPPPPAFYKLYTNFPEVHSPQPPSPPRGNYKIFGVEYGNEARDLFGNDSAKNLYRIKSGDDDIDFRAEMKRLNKALVANFIETVHLLVKNPSNFRAKLEDLECLFLNMHNIINEFRPQQARETLVEILKSQLEEKKVARQALERSVSNMKIRIEEGLAKLGHPLDVDADVLSFEVVYPAVKDEHLLNFRTETQRSEESSTAVRTGNVESVCARHLELMQSLLDGS